METMPTIRREMQARGYETSAENQTDRGAALYEALKRQRFAFTVFATMTFPSMVTEDEAIAAVDRALRALGRLNGKPTRYFYELSLERGYWYTQAVPDEEGDPALLTGWHVHMLLGGLAPTVSLRQIEQVLWRCSGGFARALAYDHDPSLCAYLTDGGRGNFLGGLQGTSDRTIRNHLNRAGHYI